MTTPNTEPIPATDAEIARLLSALQKYPDDDSPADSDIADTGITPRILIARIEQEREIRRELRELLTELDTDRNFRLYVHHSYQDRLEALLFLAAKMEGDYAR